jgi:hypothetical protein
MNFRTTSNLVLKSTLVLALALMPISALAAEQHESKGSSQHSGGGHEAQSHGGQSHGGQAHAAPSHAGGESHAGPSHAAGGAHEGAAHAPAARENRGNEGHAASRPQNRGNEGHAASSRPGGPARNEAGNASRPGNAGNRGGNAGANRGGNAGANRGGNAGANRGGNAGANRGGNAGANRGANAGANRGANAGANRGAAVGHNAAARTVSLHGGGSATLRPNGQVRSVNRNGMHISNNIHGGRTVISEHNGVRVVNRPGGGYVQHAYMNRGGHAFYSRTFYAGGGYRTGIYRGYFYHGAQYYGYYPGVWFHPGFYGWGLHPWGSPIAWGIGVGGWGWGGSPWWGYYGGWWNPYPVYAGPAFWLTDYLIAAELQSAYSSQYDTAAAADQAPYPPNQGGSNYSDNGGQSANSQVTLSPEVKEAIAEEVRAQLAEQQQQAPTQGGVTDQGAAPANSTDQVPPALDPARRTFVVDNAITVVSDGQDCELTGGDVITRLTDTPDSDNNVTASVSASKRGECGAGKQIAVSVDDLMEMHNHFEEQLNNGLKALAAKQGTNGMPAAPDTGTVASDIPAPQPDQDASKELSDQQAQANQAVQQAQQEAAAGGTGQE